MITVYICSAKEWDNKVVSKPKTPVHYFPEINYSYKEWFDFYSGLSKGYHAIVSQSSELLKFLSISAIPCKVFFLENKSLVQEKDLELARANLLSCYENLMFKEALFGV